MVRTLYCGGLLLVSAASSLFAQASTDSVVERYSRRAFPVTITVPGRVIQHTLIGTALRTKTFLQVHVYAYAIYVNADQARQQLAAWRGKTAKELEKDEGFYKALLSGTLGKSLRLHMTRDVGGDDMAEAFDEALGPRVDQAAEQGMTGGREALTEFRSFFNVEELKKETILTFACLPDGSLLTSVGGQLRSPIHSPALCRALFDVYLGEHPIMKRGKQTVVERMPEVLR